MVSQDRTWTAPQPQLASERAVTVHTTLNEPIWTKVAPRHGGGREQHAVLLLAVTSLQPPTQYRGSMAHRLWAKVTE